MGHPTGRLFRWGIALAAAGVLVVVAAVLAIPSLGTPLLGEFDPEWRDAVWRINTYNFVARWPAADLLRAAAAVGVAGLTAFAVPQLRAVAGLTAGLGVLAVGGNLLAENLPYALLMQGQPYRSLWLVQFLEIPFAFAVLSAWGTDPRPARRAAAGLVAAGAALAADPPAVWLFAGVVGAAFAALLRPRSLLGVAVGVALVVCLISVPTAKAVAGGWGTLAAAFDPSQKTRLVLEATNVAVRGAVAAGLLVAAARWPVLAGVGCAALTAGPVLLFGPGSQTETYRQLRPGIADIEFVAAALAAEPNPPARPPTVYWAAGRLEWPWFDLGAASYFHTYQLSGNVFSRATAAEGRRRMRLARPFEMAAGGLFDPAADPFWADALANAYELGPADPRPGKWPPPTAADLARLCADGRLDWVVLPFHFPEFRPLTNGRVSVYDARRIRAGHDGGPHPGG